MFSLHADLIRFRKELADAEKHGCHEMAHVIRTWIRFTEHLLAQR